MFTNLDQVRARTRRAAALLLVWLATTALLAGCGPDAATTQASPAGRSLAVAAVSPARTAARSRARKLVKQRAEAPLPRLRWEPLKLWPRFKAPAPVTLPAGRGRIAADQYSNDLLPDKPSRLMGGATPAPLAERPADPAAARRHLARGHGLYAQLRYGEAAEAYRAATSADPSLAAGHFWLGNSLSRLYHLRDAVAAYRQAAKLAPSYDTYTAMGFALLGQRDDEGAANAFRSAIDAANHHRTRVALGRYNLGRVQVYQGQLAEAAESYRASIAAVATDPKVHDALGTTLVRLQRFDEAVAWFQAVIRLNPKPRDRVDAYTKLGNAYYALARYPEAEKSYRAAVAQRPWRLDCYAGLGDTLVALDRPDEALAMYVLAAERAPGVDQVYARLASAMGALPEDRLDRRRAARAYYLLGKHYEGNARVAVAMSYYEAALRVDPGYREAAAALQRARGQQGPQ